jgi:hypothetical protein
MRIRNKRCLAVRLMLMIVPLAGGESLGMAQHLPGRPAQHLPTVYVFCYASTEKLYVSNIFPLGSSEVMRTRNAFTEFLKGHYSFAMTPGVSCTPNNTEQFAQDGKERIKTSFLRAQDQNHQTGSVIETGWTYSGGAEPAGASPAPPPPAPAASGPQPAPAAQPAVTPSKAAPASTSTSTDGAALTPESVAGVWTSGSDSIDLTVTVRKLSGRVKSGGATYQIVQGGVGSPANFTFKDDQGHLYYSSCTGTELKVKEVFSGGTLGERTYVRAK